MKTTFVASCAAALVLAGCQGSSEPSPPPTSQDALTTTDTAPTTAAPPDDVEVTSSAPEEDAAETTGASGPPEMPDEAKEDSESGAEAFALHYVDLINYTSRHPEVGLLASVSSESCSSCSNRESSVSYSAEHGEQMKEDLFIVGDSVSLHDPSASTAMVRIDVEQVGQDVVNGDGDVVDTITKQHATLVFDLSWSNRWSVDEIRVDVGKQ